MAGREAVCDSGEKFCFKLCMEAKFRAVGAFKLETFLGSGGKKKKSAHLLFLILLSESLARAVPW